MSILRYSEADITLIENTIKHSVYLNKEAYHAWPVTSLANLTPADFDSFKDVEIILIATNERIPLQLPVEVRCHLAKARIGVEVMNIGALCRTFNLLLQEGRCVAAGLIFSDN